ncbi:MAG: cytochrome-c peroxidase [Thiolinea sp.]
MTSDKIRMVFFCAFLGLFSGCNDEAEDVPASSDDKELGEAIAAHQLKGDPFKDKKLPGINDPVVQLGKDLFFSKVLSGNRDTACVSCHHPVLGGGDGLSLSIGVDAEVADLLGPGRFHRSDAQHHDGGPTVPRNAPTTFNIAAWEDVLFHDGRLETLSENEIRTPDVGLGVADSQAGENLVHAQARFPVTSLEEMKGFSLGDKSNQETRDFLAQRMGGYGDAAGLLEYPDFWLEKFRTAFKEPAATSDELITEQNISFSISEYERSQRFTETPWKYYVEGDITAISEDAKKGALLFFRSVADGGANCASCHSGDFFTDEKFHNIAMPQIGRGKGDGDGSEDLGRFRETKKAKDRYAFRTPTLLNVEMTGPWGHSGAYSSLEGVIRHHLDAEAALANYDFSQLSQPGIQNLDKMYGNTRKALDDPGFDLEVVDLSDEDVGYLVEFMKSLTDPCVKDRKCLAPWIADSESDSDPNGDQLNAIGL